MRKRGLFGRILDAFAPWLWWIAVIATIFVQTFSKCSPTDSKGSFGAVFNFLQSWASNQKDLITPIGAGCLALASVLQKRKGQNHIDKMVKKLLNQFRDKAFPKKDDYTHHRVTLFQYRSCYFGFLGYILWRAILPWGKNFRRWPWHGWLVPYERAGEQHMHSQAVFYCPDDSRKAEGFAGVLYRSRVENRLELPVVTESSPLHLKQEYATLTNMPLDYVLKKLASGSPLRQTFWGTYIQVDSKVWGVILVDSQVSKPPTKLLENFEPFASCLSQLLGKKDV